jgi:hypothetical protein
VNKAPPTQHRHVEVMVKIRDGIAAHQCGPGGAHHVWHAEWYAAGHGEYLDKEAERA